MASNRSGLLSTSWRLATPHDFDRIVAMHERLNAEDPGETMPFDGTMMRRTLAEITLNPIRGAAAILAPEGRLCGYALLISFWSNEFGGEICAIDELYVEPEFRSRGFATQFIESLAKPGNPFWHTPIAAIAVEAYRTNPRAKTLYEKLRFKASPNHSLILPLAASSRGPAANIR
jgi:GNAT superfamily N-acetyltransferase